MGAPHASRRTNRCPAPARPLSNHALVRPGWWVAIHATPTSRQKSMSSYSSTFQQYTALPWATARSASCGYSFSVANEGPTAVAPDGRGRAADQIAGRLAEQHRRQQRCGSPDPPDRGRRERHHHRAGPVGGGGRGDAEAVQQREKLALHQRAVPHGVLGLDEDLDRPAPVQHQRNQGVQRQQTGVALRPVRAPAVVPRAVLELAQLGERHRADQTGPGRRPVQPAVVHANQMAVAGQAHIAFHAVGALFQREVVGGQRVFGPSRRSAAVGDHKGMPGEHLVGPRHIPMLPVPAPATQPGQRTRVPAGPIVERPRPSGARAVRPVCARIPRRPGQRRPRSDAASR